MNNPQAPAPLISELAVAAAITLVLGTGLLLSLPDYWGDLVALATSITAGVAFLARRPRPNIVPISAVYIFVAARRGELEF